MRHLIALVAFLGVLLGAAATADAIAAQGEGPVVAWVLLRDPRVLNEVLAAGDVRLLDVRAGGRVAQLGLMLPGCG